jgi:hypothetical protein
MSPATQSPSLTQLDGQVAFEPSQRYGLHEGALPAMPAATRVHVPSAEAPSEAAQTSHPSLHALSQHKPSEQWPERH